MRFVAASFIALLGLANAAQAKIVLYVTTLSGAQEVPPVTTDAVGACYLALDEAAKFLSSTCSTNLPAITQSHIHKGGIGANGPVIVPLTTATSGILTQVNVTNVTSDVIQAISTGDAYYNFHTTANPNGEIRGQILPQNSIDTTSPAYAYAYGGVLTGAAEIPPVNTTAIGYGFAQINPVTNNLTVQIITTLDNITQSHIHLGNSTTNGPVLVALSGPVTDGVIQAVVPLNANLTAAITTGNAYFNVHTPAHPGGEIRSQIVPLSSLTGIPVTNGTATTVTATTAAPTTTSRPAAAGKAAVGAWSAGAAALIAAAMA
ncbi:CHRD domain-containing protein [Hyaloraphidium curvatum]|nr:CHRD domain-containing protein [Hyaloraphidium curvatum]